MSKIYKEKMSIDGGVYRGRWDKLRCEYGEYLNREECKNKDGGERSAEAVSRYVEMVDLVESFVEDNLYESALDVFDALLGEGIRPASELCQMLIKKVHERKPDFPAREALSLIRRAARIYGYKPFKEILLITPEYFFMVGQETGGESEQSVNFWEVYEEAMKVLNKAVESGDLVEISNGTEVMRTLMYLLRITAKCIYEASNNSFSNAFKALALAFRPKVSTVYDQFHIIDPCLNLFVKAHERHLYPQADLASQIACEIVALYLAIDVPCKFINLEILQEQLKPLSSEHLEHFLGAFPISSLAESLRAATIEDKRHYALEYPL